MQTLSIDPPIPFLLPPHETVSIVVVGCGGTGSHIAQSAARLAAHCRSINGPQIQLVLIDGDMVEEKNVGRQLFSAADVGRNKAQVLAARFSTVFGLEIVAIPHMLGGQELGLSNRRDHYGIIVGAVDTGAARRAIEDTFDRTTNLHLWLDCGNHESSGQVVVGRSLQPSHLLGALKLGVCARLPGPPLVYPELLKDAPPRPRADCAAAMLDGAQSLMVNQMMAAIAGQYLYDLIVGRKLTTFRTVVDLGSLTMRSDPITARNLSSATGLTEAQLLGLEPLKEPKKKKAKRAA
jgi:PRTRC genetic system ThiF family protein